MSSPTALTVDDVNDPAPRRFGAEDLGEPPRDAASSSGVGTTFGFRLGR